MSEPMIGPAHPSGPPADESLPGRAAIVAGLVVLGVGLLLGNAYVWNELVYLALESGAWRWLSYAVAILTWPQWFPIGLMGAAPWMMMIGLAPLLVASVLTYLLARRSLRAGAIERGGTFGAVWLATLTSAVIGSVAGTLATLALTRGLGQLDFHLVWRPIVFGTAWGAVVGLLAGFAAHRVVRTNERSSH